jgi:hypothetical protein
MLFGNPPARQADARDNVLALVIYLANYCMERYLYKFNNHKKVSAPNFTAHSELLQEEIKPATELATEDETFNALIANTLNTPGEYTLATVAADAGDIVVGKEGALAANTATVDLSAYLTGVAIVESK